MGHPDRALHFDLQQRFEIQRAFGFDRTTNLNKWNWRREKPRVELGSEGKVT